MVKLSVKKWWKLAVLILLILSLLAFLFFKLGIKYQKRKSVSWEDEWPELIRVIDGDTIEVKIDNITESVRLIGIDAAEMNEKDKYEEAMKSKEGLERLLKDKEFRLERDESQSNRDIYGRLLRYIYLENGLFVNKEMLIRGMAKEYTFIVPYKFQEEFRKSERD